LRLRIARSTSLDALREYRRAMVFSPVFGLRGVLSPDGRTGNNT
jgi:hypothetical protein